jgi:hypothetical protein
MNNTALDSPWRPSTSREIFFASALGAFAAMMLMFTSVSCLSRNWKMPPFGSS